MSKLLKELKDQIFDLETKLAEKEELLNQYPYKNDVIEKEYEDLKNAITFLMLNNIKDQEQLNHSIDVLCEKHKARIRDIENSICKIEQLEKQLAEKEAEIKQLNNRILFSQLQTPKEQILNIIGSSAYQYSPMQDKISFAVEQLEKVKEFCKEKRTPDNNDVLTINVDDELKIDDNLLKFIDNQIKELKEMK